MKIKEKDAQSKLRDARELRNSLARHAAQSLNSVKAFVTELPQLESKVADLRNAAEAAELKLHTGTSASDELESFSVVAQRLLVQLDETAVLIKQIRPGLNSFARGEK
jgi:hypothetical protein